MTIGSDRILEATVPSLNAVLYSIAILAQTLERQGILEKGAYLQALKETPTDLEKKMAPIDYGVVGFLEQALEAPDV